MLAKWCVLVALPSAVLSCSDGPTHPAGCSGDLQVSVDTHTLGPTRPVFSWSPRCGTTFVTVVTAQFGVGDPAVMWSMSVPENLSMAPPIVYGRTPPNATYSTPPQPLSPGQRYRVQVGTTVGGDALAGTGEATFIP